MARPLRPPSPVPSCVRGRTPGGEAQPRVRLTSAERGWTGIIVSVFQRAPFPFLRQFTFLTSLQTPRSPVHEGVCTVPRFLLQSPLDHAFLLENGILRFREGQEKVPQAVAFTHGKHSPDKESPIW